MSYENADALVDTAWVANHLDDPDVRIVDGSWHLPPTGRDGLAEYRESHIPGAVHFDIDAISDKASSLPHMLPSPDAFAEAVGAMGIGNDHRVVVYDADGLFSAPRVWWMFRAFGHDNVAVMAGGFRKWTAENRPVTADLPDHDNQTFNAVLRAIWCGPWSRSTAPATTAARCCSMRAPRTASTAASRSSGKGWSRATFPIPPTCPIRRSSMRRTARFAMPRRCSVRLRPSG